MTSYTTDELSHHEMEPVGTRDDILPDELEEIDQIEETVSDDLPRRSNRVGAGTGITCLEPLLEGKSHHDVKEKQFSNQGA